MKTDYSILHKSYLGKISIDNTPWFFVCYEDADSNLYFVRYKGKLALFPNVKYLLLSLSNFLNGETEEYQIINWLKRPEKISVFFEIDVGILDFPVYEILAKKVLAEKYINLYNLIRDFLIQSNRVEESDKIKKSILFRYWEFCYREFVWRRNSQYTKAELKIRKIKKSNSFKKFRNLFNDIIIKVE